LPLLTAALFAAPILTRADDNSPTTFPSPFATDLPTSRPLFDELNKETESLFRQVAPTIVRVQFPTQMAMSAQDPMAKWFSHLDPTSQRFLADYLRHAPQNTYVRVEIHPTTDPSLVSDASSSESQSSPQQNVIYFHITGFTPNGIGVVMDDDQHLLIPHYMDERLAGATVPVQLADGRMATATFIGSDLRTHLTVLKMQEVQGRAATMATDRPPDGSLMLVMSLNPALNRLAVWQGWEPDVATVINSDGQVAGFTGDGRFIPAAAYQPIAADLIAHGQVHRPVLGVVIDELDPQDKRRQDDPDLGQTPALKILNVQPGYPADRAGMQMGDLILGVAGKPVGDEYIFAAAIAELHGPTQMLIRRGHENISVTVDLGNE